MEVLSALTKLGIATSTDTRILDQASRDASLFQVKPKIVVYPQGEHDIEKLVQFVAKHKARNPTLSLTARAAGTDMGGGPLTDSIVVDMTQSFNRILGVDAKTRTATTQPGVFYRDFEKSTLAKGLLLPSYPASRELCTVGGMTANNSGGEKTLTYGKTARYVQRVRMVCADGKAHVFSKLSAAELDAKKRDHGFEGELYRGLAKLVIDNQEIIQKAKPNVTKNSAGYALWDVYDPADGSFDLTKIIVGSQGTLGLVTEVTFSLVKPKPHARMLVIFLKDMTRVAEVAACVLKHKPESFESYDDHTMKVALKVLPSLLRRMKGNIVKLGWQFLPEARMALTGGLPKLVLLAEFTAATEAQAAQAARKAYDDIVRLGLPCRVTRSEAEGQKYWTIRRESFSLLRKHVKNLQTAPFVDDFVVHPSTLSDFLPQLYAILDDYKLIYTVAGHVGDGNFHIIPLMDLSQPETKKIIQSLSKKIYSLVLTYHGSITGEHNDGLIRTPYLEQMFGANVTDLFTQTKKLFDPQNLFNPHKKVHGDMVYALRHLRTQSKTTA